MKSSSYTHAMYRKITKIIIRTNWRNFLVLTTALYYKFGSEFNIHVKYSIFHLKLMLLRWHYALQWHHNELDCVSNHQPYDCLLNHLFRRRSKKTSKLSVIGLCTGNSLGTGEFPAQMASNMENVSIWWHHHGQSYKWLSATKVSQKDLGKIS